MGARYLMAAGAIVTPSTLTLWVALGTLVTLPLALEVPWLRSALGLFDAVRVREQ